MPKNKHGSKLPLIIFLSVLVPVLYLLYPKAEPIAINEIGNQNSQKYQNIKSVTYYLSQHTPEMTLARLKKDLPRIKRAGFNTIWIVHPWNYFDPNPLLSPRTFNPAAFNNLREYLELARQNHLEVILPIQYLGEGWTPTGITFTNWNNDPVSFRAYLEFVNEYMRQIEPYHSMTYLLFTTENAVFGNHWEDSVKNARLLSNNLGNIPNLLNPSLRAKFRLGYHDYSLINLDWSSCLGTEIKTFSNHCSNTIESPIKNPIAFDFVSMVGYESYNSYNGASTRFTSQSNEQIIANLQSRADRFKQLYPNTPLIMGEYGYRGCENSGAEQARIIKTMTNFALDNRYGFNLWGWPYSTDECSSAALDGLAITNPGGAPRLAAKEVKQLLNPSMITNSGINKDYQPWAVWATGTNLSFSKNVNIYRNRKIWATRAPAFVANDQSFVSFSLPGIPAPTDLIEFELIDDLGFTSNRLQLPI